MKDKWFDYAQNYQATYVKGLEKNLEEKNEKGSLLYGISGYDELVIREALGYLKHADCIRRSINAYIRGKINGATMNRQMSDSFFENIMSYETQGERASEEMC